LIEASSNTNPDESNNGACEYQGFICCKGIVQEEARYVVVDALLVIIVCVVDHMIH